MAFKHLGAYTRSRVYQLDEELREIRKQLSFYGISEFHDGEGISKSLKSILDKYHDKRKLQEKILSSRKVKKSEHS